MPQGVSLLQQQAVRVRVSISPLQTSQTVRVAPRVINLDTNLRLASAPPSIDVTLQGPAPIMQGLGVDALGVVLDAAGLGDGVHKVKPSVSTPPTVSVASVSPETVNLVLEVAPTSTPLPTAGTPSTTAGAGSSPAGTPTPTGGIPAPTSVTR